MTQNKRIENIIEGYLSKQFTYLPTYNPIIQGKYVGNYVNLSTNNNFEIPYFLIIDGFLKRVSRNYLVDTFVSTEIKISPSKYKYASVKTAFTRIGRAGKICEVVIKDEIYYIGAGCILDKDFKILFLVSKNCNYDPIQDKYIYNNTNMYFNPKVFLKGTKMDKFIATDLFTICVNYKISYPLNDINLLIQYSQIFDTLEAPSNIETINSDITEHLLDSENILINSIIS
jgi:hypothetical protein